MRRLAIVVFAAGLSSCTSVNVEKDADGMGYTMIVPSDVFASRPMLWKYAAQKSGELCPYGWKLASAANMDSDVHWRIRCLPRPEDVPVP